MEDYQERWKEWEADPEKYWTKIARKLHWEKTWDKLVVTDKELKTIKWFVGGKLSLCYNCLDKHVDDGFGEKTAIIAESLYTKKSSKMSYKQLLDQVSHLAGALHDFGVREGDNVLLHLPMISETLVAILAVCRIGAVYSAVSLGQTVAIIKERIEEFQPKIIFTSNCGFNDEGSVPMKEILNDILKETVHKPSKCIVVQRECMNPATLHPNRDISFSDALKAKPHDWVPLEANHPLLVLFTSGSTGKPKGVVHSVAGLAVGLLRDDMEGFDFHDGKAFWGMSQFVWLGGQLAVCFGPLLGRTATVVYEGSYANPDINDVYRIFASHDITNTFIPTDELRSFRRLDPTGEIAAKYAPFSLKSAVTAGSALDLGTVNYAQKVYNMSVTQLYGQTETLAVTTHDASNGRSREDCPKTSVGKIIPGLQCKILRDDGTEAGVEEVGNIVFKMPVPPGIMLGIFKDENMFRESYLSRFPGYYDTKDVGSFDSDGYLYISSRSDSVFKIDGTRYSCDGIEKVMLENPFITECCVVLKISDDGELGNKYQPFGFYTTAKDVNNFSQVNEEVKGNVVALYGPDLECLQVFGVKNLPKTISRKPARSIIQAIVNNKYDIIKSNQTPADDDITYICEAIKSIK